MDLKQHLLDRHYDHTKYNNQILDEENSVLSVYLSNLSGQFVGFQQYRPLEQSKKMNNPKESRYFTYSQRGVNACWGLETLNPNNKTLFLVEGIFKASSLHMLGLNALALLTSNPKPMKSWLHTLPYKLVGIGDNDKAGLGMQRIAGEGFQSPLDLDEYSLEDLNKLLQERGYV